MRQIKLTGREASVVRAIGFAESMLGAEIQDHVRMEVEDVTDINVQEVPVEEVIRQLFGERKETQRAAAEQKPAAAVAT